MPHDFIKDELDVTFVSAFKTLLNHVASVLVIHDSSNVAFELLDEDGELCVGDCFEDLLKHSARVCVEGEVEDLTSDVDNYSVYDFWQVIFNQLLDNVISKSVFHEAHQLALDLGEDLDFLVAGQPIETILNESRGCLVL